MLLLRFCDEKFDGKYQKRIWGIKNDCPNFNIRQSFAFLPTISLGKEENVSFKFAFKLFRYDRKFSLNFLSLIARQIFSSFFNWNFLSLRLPIHSLCVSCFEPFNALRSINCHFHTPLADLFTLQDEIIHKFFISFNFFVFVRWDSFYEFSYWDLFLVLFIHFEIRFQW